MRLSRHQVETFEALGPGGPDVVINTAMTGDGKSLAAYLRALLDREEGVLACYGTNDLMRDQARQLESYKTLLEIRRPPTVHFVDAARLAELREMEPGVRSKPAAFQLIANRSGLLLTNPDIFTLICTGRYRDSGEAEDRLLADVIQLFPTFVFDEFHAYGPPQVASILAGVTFIRVQTRSFADRRKFVFLSATPSGDLQDRLARAGMRVEIIRGRYRHGTAPGDWRPILAGAELFVHALGERGLVGWVEEHLDQVLEFFQAHPGSRGAIIARSVAAAKIIRTLLEGAVEDRGLKMTIGESTGLTDRTVRPDALGATLVVGTSTIDLGIDFAINFLVFEADRAGEFVQRLGRLGRHRRAGESEFPRFVAHAVLPRYVVDRLAAETDGGGGLTREELARMAVGEGRERGLFAVEAGFPAYVPGWGTVKAAAMLDRLQAPGLRGAYRADIPVLEAAYEAVFAAPMARARARLRAVAGQPRGDAVLRDLIRFRGGGDVPAGVWDRSGGSDDDQGRGHVVTYDLLHLLPIAEIEVMSEDEFMAEVRRRQRPEAEFRDLDAFVQVLGYRRRREPLELSNSSFDARGQARAILGRVHARAGFQIESPRGQAIDDLNLALRRRPLTCTITRVDRPTLVHRFRLPPLFPVYRVRLRDGVDGAVAFGEAAFLLDSLLTGEARGGVANAHSGRGNWT